MSNFSFVRIATRAGGSANPETATWSVTPTQGDLLVATAVLNGAGGAAMSMSSSGWTQATSVSPSSGYIATLWWKIAGASESTSVSVANPNGAPLFVQAAEYTPPGPIVVYANAQSNSVNNNQPTPTVTPKAGVPGLVFCHSSCGGSSSLWGSEQVNGSSTGVNDRDHASTSGVGADIYDLIASSTSGGYSGQATVSSAGLGTGITAVFVSSGVGLTMIV